MIENYQLICEQVCTLAKKAGLFIKAESVSFLASSIESKGLHDLVSYVDKTSERMLVEGLLTILPEAGFITEEKTIEKTSEMYTWIIDPLDGTTNFIHRLPIFSVSIALMERHELVLGVVYEINLDELFYAWKDGPAFLNGMVIKVAQDQTLTSTLLATGFPYSVFDEIDRYLDLLKYFMQRSRGIRRLGSAAVDLAYVACGRYGGYFEYNINSYDIAGGMFILKRAGGKVTDFTGSSDETAIFRSRTCLSSNALLHEALLDAVTQIFSRS